MSASTQVIDTVIPRSLRPSNLSGNGVVDQADYTTVSISPRSGSSYSGGGNEIRFELRDVSKFINLQDSYLRYKVKFHAQVDIDDPTPSPTAPQHQIAQAGLGGGIFTDSAIDILGKQYENITNYNHYCSSEMRVFSFQRSALTKILELARFDRTNGHWLNDPKHMSNMIIHYPNHHLWRNNTAFPLMHADLDLTVRTANLKDIVKKMKSIEDVIGDNDIVMTGYTISEIVLVAKMFSPSAEYLNMYNKQIYSPEGLKIPAKAIISNSMNSNSTNEIEFPLTTGSQRSVESLRAVFVSTTRGIDNVDEYYTYSHLGLENWSITTGISKTIPQGKAFTRFDALATLVSAFQSHYLNITDDYQKFFGRSVGDEDSSRDTEERSNSFCIFYGFKNSNIDEKTFGGGLTVVPNTCALNLTFKNNLASTVKILCWLTVERILTLRPSEADWDGWWTQRPLPVEMEAAA